jgi:hypothetical protein
MKKTLLALTLALAAAGCSMHRGGTSDEQEMDRGSASDSQNSQSATSVSDTNSDSIQSSEEKQNQNP